MPIVFKLGKASLNELEGVDASLIAVVKRSIELTPQDFRVLDGLRTLEEQREMVARHASQTLDSKHLLGKAVDLVPVINGKLRWEWSPIYIVADAVRQAARELATPLRWGGAWDADFMNSTDSTEDLSMGYVARRRALGQKPFLDGPHFELLA